MIKNCILIGLISVGVSQTHAVAGNIDNLTLHVSNSDFHRYPCRALYTLDGNLVVAYRIPKSSEESSSLELVKFDGRSGHQIAERSFEISSAGRIKISDAFVLSRDGHSLYYAELTGNPIIVEFSTDTLQIVSRTTARLFESYDVLPRVDFATEKGLYLSSSSRAPGKAVHVIALDARDLSRSTSDDQISAKAGLGEAYALSFRGDSIWMGSSKYWVRIGIRSGQVEAKMQAQSDIDHLVAFSSGLIGLWDGKNDGVLQLFDNKGNQLKTLEQDGCGVRSMSLSLDERYGAAVCDRTGTSEWGFGKTLSREAVVFDLQRFAAIKSIPMSKLSLQTSIAMDEGHVWYPQPVIWDSGDLIFVGVPELSGTISVHKLTH